MARSIKISELIKELQDSLERLGDVEVYDCKSKPQICRVNGRGRV